MNKHVSELQGEDGVEDRDSANIRSWVEEKVGGEVTSIERLMRWRPVWRVEYQKNGIDKALLVKGDRPCTQLYSLKHEMQVMEVLEKHGIGVPHIHGWIEEPKAFVMDWAEGDRDPGLVHTAIENASTLSPERWQASLKYMEELARMHQIPVAEFAHTEAGNPVGAHQVALSQFDRQYRLGLEDGAIDATMEFFASWLRRNVPAHRTTPSFITGDCGQFLNKGEDVTAVLDLEIAHIGDTMMDLACFRGRHPYENMGDIPALYRHYAKASGTELDLRVIGYHTVSFLAFAAISANMFMNPDKAESNWIEGILEMASISRRALESIAELENITLDYGIRLPGPAVTPLQDSAIGKLLNEIAMLPLSKTFASWQRDLMGAIPNFLRNYAHYGQWYEGETLRDIAALTGVTSANMKEADAVLKAYVAQDDPARDAAIVQCLHRQMWRLSLVIAGSNDIEGHPLFFRLEPILDMTI
ncbi:MAG: phosphotransferase [Pseudomonadota bacterium]|nr:phosphotransferase [Pseudomonadota bacterium]